jgi:hypothetical protein
MIPQGSMHLFQQTKRVISFCYRCDKRFLGVLVLLILFNVYFFILFIFYFNDTPDFIERGAAVPHPQHIRRSPYVHPTEPSLGSNAPHDEDNNQILPSFSSDQTEFIMSATIERQTGDSDQLHLTVFALNRMLLSAGRSNWGPNRVSKEAKEQWQTAEKKMRLINYFPNGTRDKFSNINCQITTALGETPYLTSGRVVPNSLSIDDSFNSKLDIFRCELHHTMPDYSHLFSSNQSVQIQLMRRLRNGNMFSLLNFSVPWLSRRVGYMQVS